MCCLKTDQDGWAIHGWNQHLDEILKRALNDGDLARKEAERMIELLVSKGFRGYRNLLRVAAQAESCCCRLSKREHSVMRERELPPAAGCFLA